MPIKFNYSISSRRCNYTKALMESLILKYGGSLVSEQSADILLYTLFDFNPLGFLRLMKIRQKYPKKFIIVGGQGAYHYILAAELADIVVLGQGFNAIHTLCKGKFLKNKNYIFYKGLKTLPKQSMYVDWKNSYCLVGTQSYCIRQIGCRNACSFCYAPITEKRWDTDIKADNFIEPENCSDKYSNTKIISINSFLENSYRKTSRFLNVGLELPTEKSRLKYMKNKFFSNTQLIQACEKAKRLNINISYNLLAGIVSKNKFLNLFRWLERYGVRDITFRFNNCIFPGYTQEKKVSLPKMDRTKYYKEEELKDLENIFKHINYRFKMIINHKVAYFYSKIVKIKTKKGLLKVCKLMEDNKIQEDL